MKAELQYTTLRTVCSKATDTPAVDSNRAETCSEYE